MARIGRLAGIIIGITVGPAKVFATAPTFLSGQGKVGEAFSEITAELDALEASLAKSQAANVAELKKEKLSYASKLAAQQGENRDVASMNTQLAAEIEELKTKNGDFRKRAVAVEKGNKLLESGLQALQANLTLAQDFIGEALSASSEEGATELDILHELDAADAQHTSELARKKGMDEISASSHGSASMLEVEHPSTLDMANSLQGVSAHLQDLAAAQDTQLSSLKELFERKTLALSKVNMDLVTTRDELQKEKATHEELQKRLHVAVQHLAKRHTELVARTDSFKSFVHNIGSDASDSPQSEPLSLLQLPSASDMLVKPFKVFEDVTAQVNALEQRLAESQASNAEAITSRRSAYQQKIETQKMENSKVESGNRQIQASISTLEKANVEIRREAEDLKKEAKSLRADLHSFQNNFNMGEEFAVTALDRFNISVAPELRVLSEMADEEKAKDEEQASHHRFDGILEADSALSLLQVRAKTNAAPSNASPKDLLTALDSGLDAIAKEEADSLALLKEQFHKDLKIEEDKRDDLLEEQDTLTKTESSLVEVQRRLKDAVSHLQQTTKYLRSQLSSLHNFAKKLSDENQDTKEDTKEHHHHHHRSVTKEQRPTPA